VVRNQFAFNLQGQAALGRDDFFASEANKAALAWVERWPQWPGPVLIIHGAPGSGKTHLASLWCGRAAAAMIPGAKVGRALVAGLLDGRYANLAVDDADQAPELLLLNLFNASIEGGGNLLLTSRQGPGTWRPALADLGSRLRAVPAVAIGSPDDALLAAVLVKQFADRQLRVGPAVIAYLVSRIERSLAAAAEIVVALDQAALGRRAGVTVPLAGRVLAARAQPPLPRSEAGVT
jgi:chromosomal replication initiation ATPase DnaA